MVALFSSLAVALHIYSCLLYTSRAVSDETFDLAKLAEHMSKHNAPYSSGVIKGVLTLSLIHI